MSHITPLRMLAVCAAVLFPAAITHVSAQDYPTRSARLIVGFPAGGPTDILARLMGNWLSERLGQQFIIENRAGAGGNIATQAVVNAAPDGYTLLLVSHANAINATLYQTLPYVFLNDIEPVAGLVHVSNVLEVHPSVPAKTVAEFISYAKANPGKINYASAGNGTSPHLAAELFKAMTGVNIAHVPYRGSAPALVDMLAGQVQVIFDTVPTSIEHIKSGKLRALGVTTTTRADVLPDVPTIADTVPGYDVSAWWGIGVPKGTPRHIIEKLNREINAGLADKTMKLRLADLGATPDIATPSEYRAFLVAETDKWAKAVRFSGAKID